MPLFSERYGYKIYTELQRESIDDALRNGLWNAFLECCRDYLLNLGNNKIKIGEHATDIEPMRILWRDFYKEPLDTKPLEFHKAFHAIRSKYYRLDWFEVYDFVDFIAQNWDPVSSAFIQYSNKILKRECSAYRFINKQITEITSEEEIKEIEEAIKQKKPVRQHMENALIFLADRKNPNYLKSIQESISAVEVVFRKLVKDQNATLGQALKAFQKTHPLHPAFKGSIEKLWGYASDEEGIRHSLWDGTSSIGFDDAKFILVWCSALVNFLISKASKENLL